MSISAQLESSLALHYDFTNKAGKKDNIIADTVHNLEATLTNVSHDGATDGYIDDKGLLVKMTGWVKLPVNSFIDLNNKDGLTIQIVSYDTNGMHWRTEDSKVSSANNNSIVRYMKKDGTEGNRGVDSYWFKDTKGSKRIYADCLNRIGSEAVNVFTYRVNADGTCSIFINDYMNDNGRQAKPVDFASYVNTTAISPLQLKRNNVGLNTAPEKLVAFSVFNRELTDAEVRGCYDYYKNAQAFSGIAVNPATVELKVGESQFLATQALPDRYTPDTTFTYQSGNEGFVTVTDKGTITGIGEGTTHVAVTGEYQGTSYMKYVEVKVGARTEVPPTGTRVISSVAINRKKANLQVGEAYVLMATALSEELPYDIFDDNVIEWESSNPKVAKVQYGVMEGVAEGTAILTAWDETRKHSSSFEVTVTKPKEVVILDSEVYNVPLSEYGMKTYNVDSTATTNGIQSALDYAATNKFKKIVFPLGAYLVNPTVRTIKPPSDLVIDFSNSIVSIEPSVLTTKGYRMFSFRGIKNTKITRINIFGEREHTTLGTSVESCLSIIFEDCYNCGIEYSEISKSPGFNVITGTIINMNLGVRTSEAAVSYKNFELGNIDELGNLDNTKTKNFYRYNKFLDVAGVGDYYNLGYTQGYHGYQHLRSRLYSIYFYDSEYKFITAQMYNLQYYNYDKPANAKYAKVVIYQEVQPTTGDLDFGGAVAFIRTMGMPRNCFIKNCKFQDNFSTGLAMCGGDNWLLDNNYFANNRGRMPNCDIDWEDGWEHMVGDIVRNNKFNSPLGVILSCGGSLSLFDNTFNKSALLVYARTQNWRIFNNMLSEKADMATPTLATTGDSVFARNILKGLPPYKTSIAHVGAKYKVLDIGNVFVN